MSASCTCPICDKSFSAPKNMYRHMRTVHKTDADIPSKIVCPLCGNFYTAYNKLRDHISQDHNIRLESVEFSFPNKTDFLHWKGIEEKKERSFYALSANTVLKDGSKKSYYSCNRSGTYASQSTGTRAPKAHGSCKMGSHCPATIEVIEKGEIFVVHHKTHVGHEMELKHLSLSQAEKEELSRKLAEGISFERCLKDVRETIGSSLERIHLLTRQDLRNIARLLNLDHSKRHEEDAVSVALFVSEMKEKKEASPVVFFKPQDTIDEELEEKDFMLVIMTAIQRDMLCMFGSDKICIDSTHGTNEHDFYLTTIVVVDEFASGFPVSFCFSNRISSKHMEVFFKSVKTKVPGIKPKIFMSDDAPAYYNSWKKVFGAVEKQLLCTWHVDKNWKQALSKVHGTEKKLAVYKYLRTMLETTDTCQFQMLLQNFLKECSEDDDVKEFGIYFASNYANRCKLWAYCHRLYAGINTNMYLEAFHKVLKHIYMHGKVNKRVDMCLSYLLNFIKDKSFDRYRNLIKGATTKKMSEIHSRHRLGIKILDAITKIDEKWLIKSSQSDKMHYEVNEISLANEHICELKCRLCSVCIHAYTCTCIDAIVRGNMCKHIHSVHISRNVKNNSETKKESATVNEIVSSSGFDDLAVSSSGSEDQLLKNKINTMSSLLEKYDITQGTREKIHKNIDNIISLICAEQKSENKSNEPANKKIKLQDRFYSTKRKTSQTADKKTKPTMAYKLSLINYVTNSDTDDHNYSKLTD